MRTINRDPSVCPDCQGTGTKLIQMGRYTYGRKCNHEQSAQLPLEQPEFEKDFSFARLTGELLRKP